MRLSQEPISYQLETGNRDPQLEVGGGAGELFAARHSFGLPVSYDG